MSLLYAKGMERLDKAVASASEYSRKEVKKLLLQGRIKVNGQKPKTSDMKVEEKDEIRIDGALLERQRRIVALLNKPAGYVTSTDDPHSPTVMSLVPSSWQKWEVFPVGRLDKETEGLLLFTNDGDLAHRLLSPKSKVEKEYYAEHDGEATKEDVKAFDMGIELKDGTLCLPSRLNILEKGKCTITIQEGKYHQVRRMLASRFLPIIYLKRIREGGLELGELPKGEWRELSPEEERLLEENYERSK